MRDHHCPRCAQSYPGPGFVCFGPSDGSWCHRATATEPGIAPVQTVIAVQDGQTTVVDAPEAITEASGHEAIRLFEPAPVQMPGQLDMGSALDHPA